MKPKQETDRMKRVLFIGPLPPPTHGSAVVTDCIMKNSLINAMFECDFVNISTSRSMSEIGRFGILKPFRFLASLFMTFSKLLFHRYDACYIALCCHGPGFLKDAPFALLCKLFCRRLIIHQHNKGMSGCLGKQPYKWLIPWVYRNAKVILLSWNLYPDIEKVVPRQDVLICTNGIGKCSEYKYDGHAGEIPHFLFLSNLIPSKGVFALLDACKILCDKGLSFVCDFVGSETTMISKEDFLQNVHIRGLDGRVVYHGPQYGAAKEKYWSQADCFVLPTFYADECFPLVIIEAMQHSLPVVSTGEGGIPDLVKDGATGLICRGNDPDDLASCLERIIVDRNLRLELGREGLNRYNSYYTLDSFAKNFCDTLVHCIQV